MSLLANILPGIDQKLPLFNPVWLYLPDMQCNFKCKYCYMNRGGKPRGKPEHSHNFSLPQNLNEKDRWIALCGGEILTDKPLLYSLVLKIREQTFNPICFSTNGSLLELEDIEFFKKNNVKLSLSYDGKYQKYRGPDILKLKKDTIYKAIRDEVIIGLNTVIHSKNYNDYKFDLPGISIIHDYNYIYPINTGTNQEFLLDNNLSDEISDNIVNLIKSLLIEMQTLDLQQLLLEYPPSLFYFLEKILKFPKKDAVFVKESFCSQTSCIKTDIYNNKFYTCGKGLETSVKPHMSLSDTCMHCKFLTGCDFKCSEHNFDRKDCKNTYIYKTYEKVLSLLEPLSD